MLKNVGIISVSIRQDGLYRSPGIGFSTSEYGMITTIKQEVKMNIGY